MFTGEQFKRLTEKKMTTKFTNSHIKDHLFSKHLTSNFLLVSFLLIFTIGPFYSHPNFGWPSLALPINTSAWSIACWLIAVAIITVSTCKVFRVPALWRYFLALPLFIVTIGLFSEANQPIEWLFRQLFILGGLIFLFSLFQFKSKPYLIDKILFILISSTSLQAALGTVQILAPSIVPLWLPLNPGFTPRGMFQQVNVLASLLATGLVISIYFISRPSFQFSSWLTKTVVTLSFTLSTYVTVASGSRAGLLSMLIALPLVLFSRRRQLRQHKTFLCLLLVLSCGGFFAGQAGLHKTIDKSTQLADNSYSSARIAMYTIGLELVKEKPLFGYGIGGFLKAWNQQASSFIQRHPEAKLPQVTIHPHNEILLLAIEGGAAALLAIIVTIAGAIIALYKCGLQRGGAYAAMLIPITLHTQVEHPFYNSTIHWFLWLFLLYLPLRHQIKNINIKLSMAATRLIQISAIVIALTTTIFMVNTDKAEVDLFSFPYQHDKKAPYLQLALNNIYTKTRAEKVAMRSTLYANIKNGEREKVQTFISWAEQYIEKSPELKMYEDLIPAYRFLDPKERGCKIISRAIRMYAQNKPLQKANKKCQEEG